MYSYNPSSWYVLKIYAKKFLRWNRNSSPYLSVDSFADFCDINVTPPRFRGRTPSRKKIKQAESIFCDSDKLQGFLNKHHQDINAKVIVSGNTDFEFHRKLINLPATVKRCYLQNSYITDDERYRTIPIGIENFRYGMNGNPKFMKKVQSFQSRKNKILLGPFSPTHEDRSRVLESIHTNNFIDVRVERIEPNSLAKLFQEYKFVAAVRGNGVDTHRIWESLYRGCVPIVQESAWSKFLVILNLPILFINNWNTSELEGCVSSKTYPEFDPLKIAPLWMEYWQNLILMDLAD